MDVSPNRKEVGRKNHHDMDKVGSGSSSQIKKGKMLNRQHCMLELLVHSRRNMNPKEHVCVCMGKSNQPHSKKMNPV